MNPIDERALRDRLHDDLAALPPSPAPVRAVIRARRGAGAPGGRAAARGRDRRGRRGGRPRPPGRRGARPARAGRPVHARRASRRRARPGQRWPGHGGRRLRVGHGGRPAVAAVRRQHRGPRRPLPARPPAERHGRGPAAGRRADAGRDRRARLPQQMFPGGPGAGFAVLRVAGAVSRLTARLAGGGTLTARPVTVDACGRSLRLAGFAYPASGERSGVARITAYAGSPGRRHGQPAGRPGPRRGPGRRRPPRRPGRPAAPCGWSREPGSTCGGPAPRRRAARSAPGGRGAPPGGSPCCSARTASATRPTVHGGQAAAVGSTCVPITLPPGTVALHRLPLPGGTGAGRLRGAAPGPGRLPGGHPGRGRERPGPP